MPATQTQTQQQVDRSALPVAVQVQQAIPITGSVFGTRRCCRSGVLGRRQSRQREVGTLESRSRVGENVHQRNGDPALSSAPRTPLPDCGRHLVFPDPSVDARKEAELLLVFLHLLRLKHCFSQEPGICLANGFFLYTCQ